MEPPIGNGNGSVNSSSHDFLAAQKPKLPTPSKINASPIRYNPKIIQEPCRSRMSGLSSSTSRRMLDPPLVLEVDFEELNPGRNIPSYLLSNLASKLVCQVFLSDIDNNSELLSFASTIFRVFPQLTSFHQIGSGRSNSAYQDHLFPVLLGETCRGCNFIESIHERRLLFVFADLCIRLQGSFRIHCLVTDPTTQVFYCIFINCLVAESLIWPASNMSKFIPLKIILV